MDPRNRLGGAGRLQVIDCGEKGGKGIRGDSRHRVVRDSCNSLPESKLDVDKERHLVGSADVTE